MKSAFLVENGNKIPWVGFARRTTVLMVLGLLAGCVTTKPMNVPRAQISDTAPAKLVNVSVPLNEQATFALTKVVANIRRGTTIAHFPNFAADLGSGLCNFRQVGIATLEWGSGSANFSGWRDEFGEIFFDVLSGRGLKIAGDPKQLFESEKEVQAAEYSIGARIKEIKGNFCEVYDFWTGYSTKTFKGEMFVDVEWMVYSNLQKRKFLISKPKVTTNLNSPRKTASSSYFRKPLRGQPKNWRFRRSL